MLLLLTAAGALLLLGDVVEAGALGIAVGANAAIGFVTELRAEELLRGYVGDGPDHALVRRDGRATVVPVAELVRGDVLDPARAGDVVPADARVLSSEDLQLDESPLTGESAPVVKSEAPAPETSPLAERASIVHCGTVVVSGTGEALVVATGDGNELGKIARLLRETEPPRTPLEEELDRLSKRLELASLGATSAVAALGFLRGRPIGAVVRTAVALGIAAIPEGLPATATTALALGMLARSASAGSSSRSFSRPRPWARSR